MLGIVVISHSQKVAEGIKDIAEQMNDGKVKIMAEGGVDGDRIGTNPLRIKDAIEEAYTNDSVLIFADMGSAIMNAELAIDMIEDKIREHTFIVDAPLVEGVIAAVIQAAITDDIKDIIKTAIDIKYMSKI